MVTTYGPIFYLCSRKSIRKRSERMETIRQYSAFRYKNKIHFFHAWGAAAQI